ncbi:hypothetical protein BGZ83_003155 [Gryganskiella cystojenkinii]|nr:hypothetical protein BGZ83_003155 [Gryganskiella cystojenkinii]
MSLLNPVLALSNSTLGVDATMSMDPEEEEEEEAGHDTNSAIPPTAIAGRARARDRARARATTAAVARAGGVKPRTTRVTLTEAQKYEVCLYMKQQEEQQGGTAGGKMTHRAVTNYILERFKVKVDASTVSRLRKTAETRLNNNPEGFANPYMKRHRQVQFPELERRLADYVKSCLRSRTQLSDALIVRKGKELKAELNLGQESITFSDGWLSKFKLRHGLKHHPNHPDYNPIALPSSSLITPAYSDLELGRHRYREENRRRRGRPGQREGESDNDDDDDDDDSGVDDENTDHTNDARILEVIQMMAQHRTPLIVSQGTSAGTIPPHHQQPQQQQLQLQQSQSRPVPRDTMSSMTDVTDAVRAVRAMKQRTVNTSVTRSGRNATVESTQEQQQQQQQQQQSLSSASPLIDMPLARNEWTASERSIPSPQSDFDMALDTDQGMDVQSDHHQEGGEEIAEDDEDDDDDDDEEETGQAGTTAESYLQNAMAARYNSNGSSGSSGSGIINNSNHSTAGRDSLSAPLSTVSVNTGTRSIRKSRSPVKITSTTISQSVPLSRPREPTRSTALSSKIAQIDAALSLNHPTVPDVEHDVNFSSSLPTTAVPRETSSGRGDVYQQQQQQQPSHLAQGTTPYSPTPPPPGPAPSALYTPAILSTAVPSTTTSFPAAPGTSTSTPVQPPKSVSAARAHLLSQITDPIDAGFAEDPRVDFPEAAASLNTLRMFMEQQNFCADQIGDLRKIYRTLKEKLLEQQQQNAMHSRPL